MRECISYWLIVGEKNVGFIVDEATFSSTEYTVGTEDLLEYSRQLESTSGSQAPGTQIR